MNSTSFIVLIVLLIIAVFTAGFLYADRFQNSSKSRNNILVPMYSFKFGIRSKKSLSSMPSITPDPNIDYKIQRMVVDNSIDYKILDAGSHIPVPEDIKPFRKRLKPWHFRFQDFRQKLKGKPRILTTETQSSPKQDYLLKKMLDGLKKKN